jgi:hypothetical protein
VKILFELATDPYRQIQTFSPADMAGRKWLSAHLSVWQTSQSVLVICVCRASVASGWRIFMLRGDKMPWPKMVKLLQSEVI